MKTLIFFILGILPLKMFAQTIEGNIIDVYNKPVQFASIQIVESNSGTISNSEGRFVLNTKKIPIKVKISCIGLKSILMEINDTEFLTIEMEENDNVFNEVVVMPDSSLKNIIAEAYRGIEDNYTNTPYVFKGFFRNIHKVKEGEFIDFGEAYLKIYTEGYKNTQTDAQVEILKARLNKNPYRDSLDNIRYYGSVFMANSNDPVKRRADYLNPKYFKTKFIYNLESLTTYDGVDSVYVISYNSVDNSVSGKLWIEKKSKAYIKVSNINNKPNSRNILLREVKWETESTYIKGEEKRWYLLQNSADRESINIKTKKHIVHKLMFVTTEMDKNASPIPHENRTSLGAVFSEVENNYDEDFFRNENIIVADESIRQDLKKMEDDILMYRKSNVSNSQKQSTNFSSILFSIVKKVEVGYGIGHTVMRDVSPTPTAYYQNRQIEQYQNSKNTDFSFLNFQIAYSLNKRLNIFYSQSENLSKGNLFKTKHIGISYKQPLNKIGNPFYLSSSIGLGVLNSGKFVNEINQNLNFEFDNKNFGQNINTYIGTREFTFMPVIELSRKKGLYSIYVNGSYYINLLDKSMIFIEQKGFLKNKKEAFSVTGNKIFIKESNFKPQLTRPLAFTIGVKVGL
jgi:hypothetical protein